MKKHIIFLGPPGAGKGTQAKKLEYSFGIKHISTGDLLRAEIRNNTELGRKVKEIIKSGKLVSDEVVLEIIENSLSNDLILNGFSFDGFPRTVNQAVMLDKMVKKLNFNIDVVIYVEIDEKMAIERISNRRMCSKCGAVYHLIYNPPKVDNICDICGGSLYQRDDDREEIIKNRYEVYMDQTFPLVEYYSHHELLVNINGTKDQNEVFNDIIARLK
jgi:adenylate kinase